MASDNIVMYPVGSGVGAYAATATSGPRINSAGAAGIKVFLNVTAAGNGSISPVVYNTDAYGNDYILVSGLPVKTNGQSVITAHPALSGIANVTVNDCLAKNYHVDVINNYGGPVTFGASFVTLP